MKRYACFLLIAICSVMVGCGEKSHMVDDDTKQHPALLPWSNEPLELEQGYFEAVTDPTYDPNTRLWRMNVKKSDNHFQFVVILPDDKDGFHKGNHVRLCIHYYNPSDGGNGFFVTATH
jgi:hypothetical protein